MHGGRQTSARTSQRSSLWKAPRQARVIVTALEPGELVHKSTAEAGAMRRNYKRCSEHLQPLTSKQETGEEVQVAVSITNI